MAYSLKTQIYVFLLLLLPAFSQAVVSIDNTDKKMICLTSLNAKNENICFSEGDVIKVRIKEKRFKGEITEINDSTITLTRKGENQVININEVTEFRYFDKQDFWACFLVFMASAVYVVVHYLILLLVFIIFFFWALLLTNPNSNKYFFLEKWWFISSVGVVGGFLGSILFAGIFKKNPFKRFKIGKSWRADIK
jgi:hypothetical protein